MMAVFDTGAIGVYPGRQQHGRVARFRSRHLRQRDAVFCRRVAWRYSDRAGDHGQHDHAVSLRLERSGASIAADRFGDVHGRAVAISPDDQRIAIGDQDGNVAVYDLGANPIGMTQKFGAPINALGWAAQRDWLAVGTLAGEIAVLDTSADAKPIVARQTFGTSPFTALDWSAKEPALAFVCNSEAVCLWRLPARPAPGSVFRPAVRLEGHQPRHHT